MTRRARPAQRCVTCAQPPGAGYLLCSRCAFRLAGRLISVGDLLTELDITRAHLDHITPSTGRGGDQGLPFSAAAAAAHAYLVSAVTYWAAYLALARGAAAELPPHPAESAVWLARHLDWLRASDAAGVAYGELSAAVAAARRRIDRPDHRSAFPVGACPECMPSGQWCQGTVWAYVPLQPGDGPAMLRCRNPSCVRHREPWLAHEFRRAGIRILRREKDDR